MARSNGVSLAGRGWPGIECWLRSRGEFRFRLYFLDLLTYVSSIKTFLLNMATIIGYMYYFANGDTLPSGYLDIVSCDNSGDSQIL